MKIIWSKDGSAGPGISYRFWFKDTGRFMVWDDVNDRDHPYGEQIQAKVADRVWVRRMLKRYKENRLKAGLDLMAIQVVAETPQTVLGKYEVEW